MDSQNPNKQPEQKNPENSSGGDKRKWLIAGGVIAVLAVAGALFFTSSADSDLQGNVRSRGKTASPAPAVVVTPVVIDKENCGENAFFAAHEKECTNFFENLTASQSEQTAETISLESATEENNVPSTYVPVETYEPPVDVPVALGTVIVSHYPTPPVDRNTVIGSTTYYGFASTYAFTATGEDFLISTLTLENNSDESNPLANDNAVQTVRISYSKATGGYGQGFASLVNGRATFNNLELLVPAGNSTMVYITVDLKPQPGGAGTNSGDQVELDFPIEGEFLATGMTSGATLAAIGNATDVDGSNVTLTVDLPAPTPPAAPPAAPAAPLYSGSSTEN